jgi:ABC-2 type transport system permease protein
VIGTSELASDVVLQIGRQLGSDAHASGVQLVANLIDWSMEDQDLLSIRSASAFARTLPVVPESQQNVLEAVQLAAVLLALLGVVLTPRLTARKLDLPRRNA